MKAGHLAVNFNSLALPKFGKHKEKINKTLLNHFSFELELWMYYTTLTWYEQENLGPKSHSGAWLQSTVGFASTLVVSWITETLRVGSTDQ